MKSILNLTYERLKFKQACQLQDESIPAYVTRLKNLAIHCESNNLEEQVRDSVVSTCNDNNLKKKLLSEKNLTLEKVLSKGKEYEAVLAQVKEMDTKQTQKVDKDEKVMKIQTPKNQNIKSIKCFKCGQNFGPRHLKECPAIGRTCYNCGKQNHLSKVCRKGQILSHRNKNSYKSQKFNSSNINNVQSSDESSKADCCSIVQKEQIKTVNTKNKTQHVKVMNTKIKMLVDSGSSVTIIDKNTYDKLKHKNPSPTLRKTKTKLFAYGSTEPLLIKGKFRTTFETKMRYAVSNVYVLNKYDSGNVSNVKPSTSRNENHQDGEPERGNVVSNKQHNKRIDSSI